MPLNEYIINDLKPFEVDAAISELQEVFNQLTYSCSNPKRWCIFGVLVRN